MRGSRAGFTTSGGSRRRTLSPALVARMPRSRRPFTTGPASPWNSTPTMRPRPRTSATALRVRAPQLLQPALQRAALLLDLRQEARGGQPVEHGQRRRRRHRVAAERAAVVAHRRSRAPGRLAQQDGAQGQAAAERLGQGEDVRARCPRAGRRTCLPVRPRPHWTSSETSSAPALAAELGAGRAGTRRGRGRTPPSPCTGSIEHRGGLVGPIGAARRVEVVPGAEAHAGHQRLEGLAVLRVPGDGERAHRAAVEGALEADELGAALRPCPIARANLIAAFHGLRARVAEEDLGRERQRDQALGERGWPARCGRGCWRG